MGNSTHRMFLALWPPESVRTALCSLMQEWDWAEGARRYAPQDLHLTLHFLGAVPDVRLPELRDEFALAFEPFDLTLDAAGLWPRGLAVLGCQEAPQPLLELQRRLGPAVQRLHLPLELRGFRPHVTLARHALQARVPAATRPICWRVEGYCLARSTGNPAARYETVQRYPGSDIA